jgi:catechol 2,3-dioxygenase-like lactoylglutathione lyase family enzyme
MFAGSNKPRVQLTRPAYVSYGHPSLDEALEFARDFGFTEAGRTDRPVPTLHFRGYDDLPLAYVVTQTETPTFFGVTFEVASLEDLDRAERIPGATKRESMAHQPGGGERVSIIGPEGIPFHVIYGQRLVSRRELGIQIRDFNYPAPNDDDPLLKPRKGPKVRPQHGPCHVHKLGHCGYMFADTAAALDFYRTHFNLGEGDCVAHPSKPGEQAFIFLYIERGDHYVDHHSFFITASIGSRLGVHHAAFEVDNFDVQFTAHEYLKKKGYKPHWGLGRHTAGSQIFDYWYDKAGFVLEQYTDGDMVNRTTPFIQYTVEDVLTTWGPQAPYVL